VTGPPGQREEPGQTGEPGQLPVRVLIADDQKIVREGLVSLIGLLPGITVVGAAVDGHDAVSQAAQTHPDVVLMDLNMPRCNGVEATERLRTLLPGTAVVVLTTYSDDAWVFSALQAGARGFLTKDAGTDEIHRAITAVAAGHAQLDPAVQRRLLDALGSGQHFAVARAGDGRPGQPLGTAGDAGPSQPVGIAGGGSPSPADGGPAAGASTLPDELTPREAEVLAHIAAGLSNSEIAAALFVSEATVKTHINHIFTKTGLRDRAQLVGYAFRNGLASPG
jgi:DNA-binding NarL/FixJ family response regulator